MDIFLTDILKIRAFSVYGNINGITVVEHFIYLAHSCKAVRIQKLYMYTAIAPVPLAAFAGEPTQNLGKSFLKSYAAVCLEGAVIVLACIIFSVIAKANPGFDEDLPAATMVWQYIGQVVFNMLILVGTIKMSDRIVREMMGL